MKHLVIFLVLCCASVYCAGQSFEGTLLYSADIEVSRRMKAEGMTAEFFIDDLRKEGSWADTIEISYKGGNYITLEKNDRRSRTIYRADSNKTFSFEDGLDICIVRDASKYSGHAVLDDMLKEKTIVRQLDTVAVVYGCQCSVVRVENRFIFCDYYYSPSVLPADPELYRDHVYNGWYDFLKISRALPLKIVQHGKEATTILTLIDARSGKTDDSVFLLPDLTAEPEFIGIPYTTVMRIKN